MIWTKELSEQREGVEWNQVTVCNTGQKYLLGSYVLQEKA